MMRKQWIACAIAIGFFAASALPVVAAETADEKAATAVVNALADAYGKKDASERLDRIFHENLSYGHSAGALETKADAMKAVPNWKSMKINSAKVTVSGPVAVARTVMDMESVKGSVISKMNILWVLVKEQQDWKVVARQAVRGPETTPAQ